MALTAGLTDLMVSAAAQGSANAAQQSQMNNYEQQAQPLPSFTSSLWACNRINGKWNLVETLNGTTAAYSNGLSKADCLAAAKRLNGG
jgi:hypothetical protein